jgi:hypothetical protein
VDVTDHPGTDDRKADLGSCAHGTALHREADLVVAAVVGEEVKEREVVVGVCTAR